jgi:DNA polymerase-3 subunit chi
MTRIDFYLLENTPDNLEIVACRLAEKAFRQGHQTFVLTPGQDDVRRLDDLLWTFSAGSFVPHSLQDEGSGADDLPPVLIGHQEPSPACHDVLITLLPEVPGCFSRFQRVAEFVGPTGEEKRLARERFRFYRDRGYVLETHTL